MAMSRTRFIWLSFLDVSFPNSWRGQTDRKPSIKPFFGETRLERRFRLLSVASISLVIFVALWQVERLF